MLDNVRRMSPTRIGKAINTMGPRCHMHFGYCDDLAIASLGIQKAWTQLKKIFKVISLVSLLEMNGDKTQFCIVCNHTIQSIAEQMTSDDLELSISQFNPFVKYLGVYLGRDTTFKNWERPSVSLGILYCS